MAGKSTEKPVSAPKEEKKTLLETPSAPRAVEAKQDIKVPAAVKEIVKEEIKVEQPYVAPTPVPVEVSEPTPAPAPAPQVEPRLSFLKLLHRRHKPHPPKPNRWV